MANKVIICKPGCTLQPRPNKTNLQLRELEAMQIAMRDGNVEAELMTIQQIKDAALELDGASIICFNSAACFDNELVDLLAVCSVLDTVDLTLVSNDCRLGFKVYEQGKFYIDRLMRHRLDGDVNIRILTNASKDLEDYASNIIDWPGFEQLPIHFSALFTLPSFMAGAKTAEKSKDATFTCMHFCDYSDERQRALIALKEAFGESLTLSGDMSGMIVNGEEVESIVTDTATVWQWYKAYKVTPVLLEPNYDKYGVMPNRVSEAITCRCLPILATANIDNYKAMEGIALPVVQIQNVANVSELIDIMKNYIVQYNDASVQQQLDILQKQLGMYKTQFVVQMQTLFGSQQ